MRCENAREELAGLTVVHERAQLNDDARNGKNERTKSESTVQRREHGNKVYGGGRRALRTAHFLHLGPRAHEKHGASDGHYVAQSKGDGELPWNDKKHRDCQKVEKKSHGEAGGEANQPICTGQRQLFGQVFNERFGRLWLPASNETENKK